ncbi:hypothetical protein IS481_07775 [Caldimonas thermodepolymerans]|jgi:hypothetical protein|uniref:Uncharacterized protein n=1 Tax=Caldimonas thermodepolymerans TaxID=215580 RepID=A0AA46DHC4_9BURK|nr:hypothetical protein [Caldimonas thermodepolymerans]QPC33030.1 hypothetical protein IS481_07775 [Caldimonas thermodepolymerans]RDI03816.1 hypothetical protein DES46_101504 [Caldimonas thermodepolymerans]TCP09783.1 hypothetical protein EV676_101362 [Caldimonas thermodepolymerans]UZG45899.1 hypothetical protein ONZ46_08125 [Caldimonas thermodepolymerans]UZG49792.1 hypothetical protein ONS87_09290 [Caldimonas thermodepolymerans]
MSGAERPGPVCAWSVSRPAVWDGTACLQAATTPGPTGSAGQRDAELRELEAALRALQVTALNFGRSFVNDAGVRENYVRRIAEMSRTILADVRAGRATPREGAELAVQLRNVIMEEARVQSSVIGRAQAERLKATGKTIEQLVDATTEKLFPGRSFGALEPAQRRRVFEHIVESSGRSRPAVTSQIPRWRLMGRACVAFTVAVSVYNIWTAEHRVHAGLREGLVLGGGAAGAAMTGAATGLVCGPGAPVCSTVLFLVGGLMGALAADRIADRYDEELREFARWLGEGW